MKTFLSRTPLLALAGIACLLFACYHPSHALLAAFGEYERLLLEVSRIESPEARDPRPVLDAADRIELHWAALDGEAQMDTDVQRRIGDRIDFLRAFTYMLFFDLEEWRGTQTLLRHLLEAGVEEREIEEALLALGPELLDYVDSILEEPAAAAFRRCRSPAVDWQAWWSFLRENPKPWADVYMILAPEMAAEVSRL